MNAKTHTTAVVLIPPEAVWEPIQTIQRQHDRNARRWMPHITLLYPFAPQAAFAKLVPDLVARFDVFTHGRSGATLFLVPEPAAGWSHSRSSSGRQRPPTMIPTVTQMGSPRT